MTIEYYHLKFSLKSATTVFRKTQRLPCGISHRMSYLGITPSLTQFTRLPFPFLLPSFFPSFLPFSPYCTARAGCCTAPCDCRPVARHLLQDSPTPGLGSPPSPQQLRCVFFNRRPHHSEQPSTLPPPATASLPVASN